MEKFCTNIAKYIFIILASIFSVANIFFTVRFINDGKCINNYNFGLTPIHIVITIVLICILIYLNKKSYFNINEKYYLYTVLTIAFIVGIYWIVSNPRVLIEYDDSYNCFESAKAILNGDYGALGYKSYINTYPHNLPLVTYFMLIIKIFGENNSILVINVINLIFVIVGYLYLYKISSMLFNNKKTNLNTITLILLSFQYVFFSYYVYGNAVSISLSFVSIYYLIKHIRDKKISSFVLCFTSIGIGVGTKNNAMIVLVAELIVLLLETLKTKRFTLLLLAFVMIFSTYICTNGVVKFWEMKASYSYDNKLPKICWIGYGLNYDEIHPGSYLNDFEKYHVENGYVSEFTEERVKDFIEGTFNDFKKDPSLVPKFLGEKLLIAWTNPEYGVFSYGHITKDNTSEFNYSVINGNVNELLNTIWDGALSVVSIGLLVYVYKRRKEIELQELILAIVFIGGFLFHSFWELKSIYMYHYYLCLLPYAAHGLMLLFNKK